jgi:hypothetical protein
MKRNYMGCMRIAPLIFSVLLIACSQRGYTPSFEELHTGKLPIAQKLASERSLFFKSENEGHEQLKKLVTSRLEAGLGIGSYLLGPGDELTLVSEDPEELNVDVVVSEDGHVTLPIVGTVNVQGLTKVQFTETLHTLLGRFIRKPNVRIRVKKYASQRVTVIGAVNKPGEVTLDTGSNTLLRILGKAGGLSSRAANFV